MNCYYHNENVAVGICYKCMKGLCPSCTIDLGFGLSCSMHQDDVKVVNALIKRNVIISDTNKGFRLLWPLVFVMMGIVMGISSFWYRKHFNLEQTAVSLLFIIAGLVSFVANNKAFKKLK